MVEQIQTQPSYDSLVSSGVLSADPQSGKSQTGALSSSPSKQGDTVTLSASVQATQLYHQGKSVLEISELLGIPTATLDADLNLPAGTVSSAPDLQPTTAQSAATVTPADASTPGHASSSPYTVPAVQVNAEKI